MRVDTERASAPSPTRLRAQTESLTQHLNRPIAFRFILGASLFFVAATLSLLNIGSAFTQNMIYFVGIHLLHPRWISPIPSIDQQQRGYPPTKSLEALAAGGPGSPVGSISGWSSLSFIGTIFFNFNTFDAFLSHTLETDLISIGMPDLVGSILFLISGTLGVIEFNHRIIFWPKRSRQSSITIINFWGCILFMGSAILAPVVFLSPSEWSALASVGMTAAGALAFLISSTLMLSEK